MEKTYFEISNNLSLPLKFDLRLIKENKNKPLNIVLHGFKAYRNWGFIPYLSEKLANNCGPTINLDFSLNGIVDEDKMLYDIDIFRINTVSQQLKDISILLNELQNQNSVIYNNLKDNWNGEINLIGHSLGGACSMITAFENPLISKIILWGTISKTDRNTQRQKNQWREKGYIEFKESHSGQTLYLDVEYLEDKERNSKRIDLRKIISELKIPICIIHGKLDFTVKLNEAEILVSKAINSNNLEHLYIEKCNHTFGVSHKFDNTNVSLENAIEKTMKFINK